MNNEILAHMRDRVRRTRRLIELAHNREMIAILEQMIREAEADIRRLETQTRDPADGES